MKSVIVRSSSHGTFFILFHTLHFKSTLKYIFSFSFKCLNPVFDERSELFFHSQNRVPHIRRVFMHPRYRSDSLGIRGIISELLKGVSVSSPYCYSRNEGWVCVIQWGLPLSKTSDPVMMLTSSHCLILELHDLLQVRNSKLRCRHPLKKRD